LLQWFNAAFRIDPDADLLKLVCVPPGARTRKTLPAVSENAIMYGLHGSAVCRCSKPNEGRDNNNNAVPSSIFGETSEYIQNKKS
jgi:hypothetical protein